jgi:hypothetical protein
MKLLPNYQKAVIPDEKIFDYCLNPNHERGRHKAKVFKKVFGLTQQDGELLKSAILEQLGKFEIETMAENKFGRIFSIPMRITLFGVTDEIMTAWIIENGEDSPRLTSCYVNR